MTKTGVADQGTIKAGRFTLPYRIEGTDHPTIVIGSALYYSRVFSQRLRDHLRLVLMDHRGFAPSPGPVDNSEFELEAVIDDVEKLRTDLDLGRVAVVGHSGHAFMALEYGKKYPEHTSHVIMIGVSPVFGEGMIEEAEENWQSIASSVADDRPLAVPACYAIWHPKPHHSPTSAAGRSQLKPNPLGG